MTSLILAARELRVAARQASTQLDRVSISGVSVVFSIMIILTVSLLGRSRDLGPMIFAVFAWAAWVYALMAGPMRTADAISSERREGTLGLLFLTPLRPHHVIGGKVAATALRAIYGLVAMMPVLGLALLFGGVAWDEFLVVCLNLLNTIFFSLCLGLAVSSRCERQSLAAGITLACTFFFAAVIPLIAAVVWEESRSRAWFAGLLAFSPAGSQWVASQWGWRTSWKEFVGCFAVLHSLAWAFFAYAVVRTRDNRPAALSVKKSKPAEPSAPQRRKKSISNPLVWLVLRRGSWFMRGVIVALIAIWLLILILVNDDIEWPPFFWLSAAGLDFALKYHTASVASSEIAEERTNGALALLLSTPVKLADVIRARRQAVLRLIARPYLLQVALLFLGWLSSLAENWHAPERGLAVGFVTIWIISSMANLNALLWCGIAEGFRKRSGILATWSACAQVLVPIGAVFFAGMGLAGYLGIGQSVRGLGVPWAMISWFGVLSIGNSLLTQHRAKVSLSKLDLDGVLLPAPQPRGIGNIRIALRRIWTSRWPMTARVGIALLALALVGLGVLEFRKLRLRRMVNNELARLKLPPPVPLRILASDQNAAEWVLEASRAFNTAQQKAGRGRAPFEVQFSRNPSTNDLQQMATAAITFETSIAWLRAGMQVQEGAYLTARQPYDQYLVPPWQIWQLARTVQMSALHYVYSGDAEKAVDGIRILLWLAHTLREEPSITIQGFRLNCLSFACEVVGPLLSAFPLKPEHLAELETKFSNGHYPAGLSKAIESERLAFLKWQNLPVAEQAAMTQMRARGPEFYIIGLLFAVRNASGSKETEILKVLEASELALERTTNRTAIERISQRNYWSSGLAPGLGTRQFWQLVDVWRREGSVGTHLTNVMTALRVEQFRSKNGGTIPDTKQLKVLLQPQQAGSFSKLEKGYEVGRGEERIVVQRK